MTQMRYNMSLKYDKGSENGEKVQVFPHPLRKFAIGHFAIRKDLH